MKELLFKLVIGLLALTLVMAGCSQVLPTEKIEVVRLVGTIGPLSIPLAYMVENQSLDTIAESTTLNIWANPMQLQAIVTGNQADFISLPTNSAAIYYNRGVSLKLLDTSIWNILYLVTSDVQIRAVSDLRGKRVVVPYQGVVPDVMFQYVCRKQGIDPTRDLEIIYTTDPILGSQLLLSSREKYVLLSEPSATAVILNGQKASLNLFRALNMQTEWQRASGKKTRTPVAGTIVLGDLKNNAKVVKAFSSEYNKAIQWMLEHPVEAGKVGAKVLAEQGFTAEVLTNSLKNISWEYIKAGTARTDIEAFYQALGEVSPDYIGGQVPDSAFYYEE